MRHIEEAKAARRRKDYRTAIRHYDKAIALSPSPQLYNERSDCYARVGDIKVALKDAKTAIQSAKNDPSGYLRAAKLLIKSAAEDAALEVLGLGLRNVKHTGEGYLALQSLQSEILGKRSKPTDPLTVLPAELALNILQMLSFRQVVSITRASKQWHTFIAASPSLWTHLDLQGARTKVKQKFIIRAIQSSQRGIQRATLDNLVHFDDALDALTRTCKLAQLDLYRTPRLDERFEACLRKSHIGSLHFHNPAAIAPKTLSSVVQHARERLTSLTCRVNDGEMGSDEYTRLQSLALTCHAPNLYPILSQMSSLRTATLDLRPVKNGFRHMNNRYRYDMLTNLTRLEVRYDRLLMDSLLLPDSLCTFIARCNLAHSLTPGSDKHPNNQNLTHLEIRAEVPIYLRQVMDCFFTPGADYKFLHIEPCDFASEPEVFDGLCNNTRLKSLSTLQLPGAIGLEDTRLNQLSQGMAMLESLDIRGTDVRGGGIRKAVMAGVKSINLDGRVDHDVVNWARSRGVKIRQSIKQ